MKINQNISRISRNRRGQTKVESAFALALLIVAGFGAWKLYGDPIRITTREMIEYFLPGDKTDEPLSGAVRPEVNGVETA